MAELRDLPMIMFDDARARQWQPFRLTRPIGELRFGCMSLEKRMGWTVGNRIQAYLGCDDLKGFEESDPQTPHIALAGEHPEGEERGYKPVLVISSRAVLEFGARSVIRERAAAWPNGAQPGTTQRVTLVVGGQVVGWLIPRFHELPSPAEIADPAAVESAEVLELPGTVLEWPWNLVEANAARVAADIPGLHPAERTDPTRFKVVGAHDVFVHESATVEDGVVLDAREGPIRIERDVYVQAPARLTGPLHVAQGSLIFGGAIGHSSIGPVCKVRGEIDSSVLCGYDNKAHDGYLGHALVGRWVNLGAMTTNSDLKNNYSIVRVRLGGEDVDSGLMKVGCFLGDHVKTGIGTLITTGAVIGAGSNVFGGGITPRWVPAFSWGSGSELGVHDVERFLSTTQLAMSRRSIELGEETAALYRRAFEQTARERKG